MADDSQRIVTRLPPRSEAAHGVGDALSRDVRRARESEARAIAVDDEIGRVMRELEITRRKRLGRIAGVRDWARMTAACACLVLGFVGLLLPDAASLNAQAFHLLGGGLGLMGVDPAWNVLMRIAKEA